MNALGIDRRILRAFYTQYIAVLLIVLVFFVAAFQRSGARQTGMSPSVVHSLNHELALATPITLSPFREGVGVDTANSQLQAISELLRVHDIEATFVFGVTTSPEELQTPELSTISAHVDALERFFEEQRLPKGATRYLIEQVKTPQKDSIALILRAQGGEHE